LNAEVKTVLFFSCEPGGAEVLIPVIRLLAQTTPCRVIVLSYGLGAERFARKGTEYIEIASLKEDDDAVIAAFQPALIITSATSLPERDMSEKYLWRIARRAGIPSIAFLDQWQNYAIRFSGVLASERLAYLPDYINCINAIGALEMVGEGFEPQRLVEFGQPYLASLAHDAALLDVADIRHGQGIAPDARVILFASEAIREHYGNSRGYDQYDALGLLLERVSREGGGAVLLVKLHPKDAPAEYMKILGEYPALRAIMIKNELSPLECIAVSDEVYGMTSIMLIEAYILGKKVASLQPGLKVADPCVLSRHGVIPLLLSRDVEAPIRWASSGPGSFKFDFEFQKEKFMEFFQSKLSHSHDRL
jgi:hypothetical protein